MRERSGVSAGLIDLPSGGGGVAPLGERFQPDLVRGTGSYGVPINCPKGPNELQPSLSLAYSTGSGNGPFGLGWRLNILRIERRSDRGIPTYTDEDTFVLGDAEVLIHVGGQRYRPQTDNKFWHIEKRAAGWRVRMGDGRTLLFGQIAASQESDGVRIFSWYLDEERDPAGNSIHYSYRRDGNRLYLEEVRYSVFKLLFNYEQRPDVLRNGRSGFLRLADLRTRSIELHCERLAPTLMRTYGFIYEQAENGVSLLQRITLSAEEDGETSGFPDLSFEYARPNFYNWQIHEPQALVNPPDLEDRTAQLVDMTSDGLPDIMQSSGSRMYLWRNRGDGWLEGPTALEGIPSTVNLARENVAFADLTGNGRVDLFAADQPLQVIFEADGKGGFLQKPVIIQQRPNLRLAAGNTRLMDVDGNGIIDLLSSGRNNFLLYRFVPGTGWQDPQAVRRVSDIEHFPDLAIGNRFTRLADMTGDGLQDFVLVQSGNFCYWPYLGNGVWGDRVELHNSPRLPVGYREDRLYMADLDGDGCEDVIYMDYDRILIWLNKSGSGFAAPIEIPVSLGNGSNRVIPVDFFGDGRLGFIWSAGVNREYSSGYRFLRFDKGRKPYLMTTIDNGMGGGFEMTYSTSTEMRLEDEAVGRKWPGELPFPTHVVRAIRERDQVTGRVAELSFKYHDGVYDGLEREFRGFRQVDVDMAGDDSIPSSRQEYTFFQGDPDQSNPNERKRQRALAGALLRTKTFEWVEDHFELRHTSVQTWETRLEHDGPCGSVYFPFMSQIETQEHSLGSSPTRIERTLFKDYDAHGNPTKRIRESFAEGQHPADWIKTEERFSYLDNEDAWLIKLPVRLELCSGSGEPFAVKITYYDGQDFMGLPEGEAARGLVSRIQELQLLESKLPADYIGSRDMTALGYELTGTGDTRGYYATSIAYKRDDKGNVLQQKDPLGHLLTIEYDADNLFPVKTIDAVGRETVFVFNPRAGEPARVTFPDSRIIRYEHDPIGRLVATYETNDVGDQQLVKCWVLDLSATPASVTSIAPTMGGRARHEFGPSTDFTSLSEVSVSRIYYDGFGKQSLQVSTAPDGPGGVARFVTAPRADLNPRGLTAANHPPVFVPDLTYTPNTASAEARVRYRYDVLGNVTETAGPGSIHHRIVRDTFTIHHYEGTAAGAFGNVLPPGPPSRIEHYDSRARLIRIQESRDTTTVITIRYKLAVDGRIETIYDDADQEVVRYHFAGAGEPIRITHRDVGTRTYYRNAAGHVVERTNTDGSTLFYEYDALGRVTRIEHTSPGDGSPQVVRELFYDHDPLQPSDGRFLDGRIAVINEAGNEIRYSYNHAGKMVKEEVSIEGTTMVTAKEYDLQGRQTATIYPDGHRVEYTRDNSGVVMGIPGVVSDVTYEADGAVGAYDCANGVKVSMQRDPVSRRLAEISAHRDLNILRRCTYAYDSVGNIVGLRDDMPGDVRQHTFGYDGLYRLTDEKVQQNDFAGPMLREGSYAYDASGNMQQFGEGTPLTLSYDHPARPGRTTGITAGSQSQTINYDDRGNMAVFGELATIEYDSLDRVSRVVKSDGTELRFAYDPQSRRILKEVKKGGITRRVYYVTGLYELHEAHAIRHIYLGRRLVASEKVMLNVPAVPSPLYYLSDHHGTILLATDATGAVVHNQRYSPFGTPLNTSDSLDRYLGRERDAETGLLQLGVRYYAPAIGRFVSPDWFVLENPDKAVRMPQGYNLYSYALNNPLVFRDPRGMWFLIDDLIVAAVGFVVGFVTGLIYGLVNGQGWGSLLTALETGLTTAAGAWLGWNIAGPIGAVMGGMNGLISGVNGIYDWSSIDGWFAFISDSTWGLLGTSLGNIVHIINLFYSDANYRGDLSRRQNRHVYEGGFALKSDFAFTQGNVISNAGLGRGAAGINASFIANHEELHIWQSRFFGPLFQATYVVWGVGGFLVGTVVWFFNTDEDYGSIIETAAYYDNPFEYWAYSNDTNWPPSGANPVIAWG